MKHHEDKRFIPIFLAALFLLFTLAGCERVNQKRARRLANRAVKAIKEQHYFTALNLLKEAVRLYPHDANTRLLLAQVYRKRSQPTDAIQEYKRCLYLDPKKHQAHYSLGNLYFEKEKYKDAAESYQKLIALKPNHIYGQYQLASSLHKLKRYAAADKHFLKTITIKKSFVNAYNGRAALFYDQAKQQTDPNQASPQYNTAVRSILEAVRAGIANEQSYNLLGLVYQSQKQFKNAIDALLKAKKINSYSSVAAYNLGATYDLWLEELLNQAKEEKKKKKREELMQLAGKKRDEAINFFKDFLQLSHKDEGLKQQIRVKIRKLSLMKDKALLKEINQRKKRRRPRKRK